MGRHLAAVFAGVALASACAEPLAARPPSAPPPHLAAQPAPGPPPSPLAPDGPTPGGHVQVRFLDVGQGDGAVITTDDGASLLLDLGPKDAAPRIDEQVAKLGGAVTAVLLTHAHADHLGQLDTLAKQARVGAFWEPGFSEKPTATYPHALRVFEQRQVPHVVARRGMHLRLGQHVDLEILAPREPLLRHTRSDPNANSVVVRLTHPGRERTVHMLFTGDAEHVTEERLLEAPAALAADVLKVAHHGSKHASSAGFLRAVGARVAVVSCGRGNDYGHPHQATLRRLADAGLELHRTDLEGDVTVDSDGSGVVAKGTRSASAEELRTPGRAPKPSAGHEAEAP